MFGPIIILIGFGVTVYEVAKKKAARKAAAATASDPSRTGPTPEKTVESGSQDPPPQS